MVGSTNIILSNIKGNTMEKKKIQQKNKNTYLVRLTDYTCNLIQSVQLATTFDDVYQLAVTDMSRYMREKCRNPQNWETLDDFKNDCIKRIIKVRNKKRDDFTTLCDELESIALVKEIKISVDWKRSQLYGLNPMAEVSAWTEKGEVYITKSRRVTGYGFCKLSTAVAEALNDNKAIMSIMHVCESENLPYGVNAFHRQPNAIFVGGVGVDCYFEVFDAIGLVCTEVSNADTFNSYYIYRV